MPRRRSSVFAFVVVAIRVGAVLKSAGISPKRRPKPWEPIARDRQHAVHRRFELEFPVSAVGL